MNKLIAVVGMSGTGKSVATDYLEKKGYHKIYFGGVIYQKMKEENIEITPSSQRLYREALRSKYGMAAVAILLLDEIKESYQKQDTVLDGLYSWDEYLTLKKEFKDNLKMICVCTDKAIRYNRVANRKDRPFNHDEIIARDISEIENLAKGGPIAYSDYYILNNGDLNNYYTRLEEILLDIDKGEK